MAKKKTREEQIADIIFGVYGKDVKQKKLSKMGVAKQEMNKIAKRYRKVMAKVLRKHGKEMPDEIGNSFDDVASALNSIELKPEMRKLYFEMYVDPYGSLLSEVSKEITSLYTVVVKDEVKSILRTEPAIVESLKELKIYLNKEKQKVPNWANYAVRTKDGRWFWQAEKDAKSSKKKWTGYEDRNGHQVVTVSVNNIKESLDEANVEFRDINTAPGQQKIKVIIGVGDKKKEITFGDLKNDYRNLYAAISKKMKEGVIDPKTRKKVVGIRALGGNDGTWDVITKADGTLIITPDA